MKHWKPGHLLWGLQFLVLFVLSNLCLSYLPLRWDLSRSQRFSLTESTEMILSELPAKLYIEAYYSKEVPGEYKARLDLAKEMLQSIASTNSEKIELQFLDPDSNSKDRERALSLGIEPQSLQKVTNTSAEVKQAFFGVVLTMGTKVEVIPVLFFAEEVELQFLTVVRRMIQSEPTSFVGILVAEGSYGYPVPGEDTGKNTFGLFVHQAFVPDYGETIPVSINQEPVPTDVEVLLWVGAPILEKMGKYHLDQYLMRGGRLIVLGSSMQFTVEPGSGSSSLSLESKGLAEAVPQIADINRFLGHYGIRILPEMILEPENSLPMGPLIEVESGVFGRYHYPLWVVASKETNSLSDHNLTEFSEALLLPWVSGLELKSESQPQAKLEIIAQTSSNAKRKKDYLFVSESEVAKIPLEGKGETIPIAVFAKGKFTSYFKDQSLPFNPSTFPYLDSTPEGKETQILVLGTPYLVSDMLALREYRDIFQKTNIPFLINAIDFLKGDMGMIQARSKKTAIQVLQPTTRGEEIMISLLNIVLGATAILGYAFFRLRKRQLRRNQ